jgi:acetoin utilization protein AcuB
VHRRAIRQFMSTDFVRVRPDAPVREAHALMRSANKRDLLVMDGERLLGVITQLDLYLIQSLTDADPGSAVVEEAMSAQPYVVGPETALEEVARTMWKERCGCAVIVDQEQVIGIFTGVDALEALSQVLGGEDDEEASGAPIVEATPVIE